MYNYKGKMRTIFGTIYYIGWLWKSIVKVRHIKIFIGKINLVQKEYSFPFSQNMIHNLKIFSIFNLRMTSSPNFYALSLSPTFTHKCLVQLYQGLSPLLPPPPPTTLSPSFRSPPTFPSLGNYFCSAPLLCYPLCYHST